LLFSRCAHLCFSPLKFSVTNFASGRIP
jgi:hypothetical protein